MPQPQPTAPSTLAPQNQESVDVATSRFPGVVRMSVVPSKELLAALKAGGKVTRIGHKDA